MGVGEYKILLQKALGLTWSWITYLQISIPRTATQCALFTWLAVGGTTLAVENFEEQDHICQLEFYAKSSGEVTNHRPLHCQYLTMEMVRNTMSDATHSQRGIFSVEPIEEVGL